MRAPASSLVPSLELEAIEAYLSGGPSDFLEPLFDRLGVPREAQPSRLEIAVAQILLHGRQNELPQWAATDAEGEVLLGRHAMKRPKKAARLSFHPQLVCCINWADSGPGYSWPEAYHVTRIPGFDKFIVTASRDSPDAWGCTDHAIGFCDADLGATEAAHRLIVAFWRSMFESFEQERWAYLFDTGLVGSEKANEWAVEVWGSEDVDEEMDEDC